MNRKGEYITLEWAKQLVYAKVGKKFDYANMKMIIIPPGRSRYCIPVWQETKILPITSGRFPDHSWYEVDEVELQRIYDPFNLEVTCIGYGEMSNTIIIDETVGIEYLL